MGFERGGKVAGLRDVAGKVRVAAAGLLDHRPNMSRRAIAARQADHVMARPCEGACEVGAKTFGDAGHEQHGAGHSDQIQRRMLAITAICASQPAVKVSVRASGTAAE